MKKECVPKERFSFMPIQIAIFASGGGSNAQKIIETFQDSSIARVALVVSNKKDAGVLKMAESLGVPTHVIDRKSFYETEDLLSILKEKNIEFLVLAGFLWLVPAWLINVYEGKIINIHPALLPNFGGKGMYGMHVHNAVKAAGETKSGMTIHFVNEHYDEGDIVFQASCEIEPTDTASDIASKVLKLEHEYYSPVILKALHLSGVIAR